MREPVERTKDLIAVHNIREDNLRKALDLGGFPMPSIAIAKNDTLIRILEDLSEDADFIRNITALSPETIDKAVERKLLHRSERRR